MNIRLEPLTSDLAEEIAPMLDAHYEEVAMYQEHIDLNVDWEAYKIIEEANSLRIFTWREDTDDGRLVGYNVFFVKVHPHYMDHLYAANDILYVHPDYRNEKTAFFISWCESALKEEDVSVITYHMKENKPFHSLMEACKYDHAEHNYTKYIGD